MGEEVEIHGVDAGVEGVGGFYTSKQLLVKPPKRNQEKIKKQRVKGRSGERNTQSREGKRKTNPRKWNHRDPSATYK